MRLRRTAALVAALTLMMTATASPASAKPKDAPGDVVETGLNFVLGLTDGPGDRLLVADAATGLWEIHKGEVTLFSALPGVSDAVFVGGRAYALVNTATDEDAGEQLLVEVKRNGDVETIADLGAFEAANNPDGGAIDSNPYGIAALPGKRFLIADAGGNDLLLVGKKGDVEVVAVFPWQTVSTGHLSPEENALLGLPPVAIDIDAEPVPTSVAVGPDGFFYVGELSGFPGAPGASRVWRIAPFARNAQCGSFGESACRVVGTGFTSIVDLAFAPNGTLYVDELTESGFMVAELGLRDPLPGTIDSLDVRSGVSAAVTSLILPTAIAVGAKGSLYATQFGLVPGLAQVVRVL